MLDARMEAIANAAEGDMGRNAFRDLILSFRLPRKVVGLRLSLLLSREAHAEARKANSDVLHRAHGFAMRGPLHTWKHNSTDMIERACAILAGAAMLMSTGNSEDVRNGIAFEGRIWLPFLATPITALGSVKHRIFYCDDEWVLCDAAHDPQITVSRKGIEGLQESITRLLDSVGISKVKDTQEVDVGEEGSQENTDTERDRDRDENEDQENGTTGFAEVGDINEYTTCQVCHECEGCTCVGRTFF